MLFIRAASQNVPDGFYIRNSDSKVPVAETVVQSRGDVFAVTADENGFVSFRTLPDTIIYVIISRIGYETKTVNVRDVLASTTPVVYLDAKISTLEEVMVQATTGNNILKPISDLDIHLRPVSNSQEVLRLVPGLFIGQHAGGGKAEQLFLRALT